jgi:hypothetical protein
MKKCYRNFIEQLGSSFNQKAASSYTEFFELSIKISAAAKSKDR